jgi:hypothetical protein
MIDPARRLHSGTAWLPTPCAPTRAPCLLSTCRMPTHTNVFVFISSDRKLFGLSIDVDGANLPGRNGWNAYDIIPMSANYLSRYADDPDTLSADLATHGFHIVPTRGNIIPFPKGSKG